MIDVLTAFSRPWAPFAVGFAIGTGVSLWALYDGSWRMRHSLPNPWDHDSEYEKAYAAFKRTDWRWSVILGSPFVLGVIVWVVWFLLTLAAGIGGT